MTAPPASYACMPRPSVRQGSFAIRAVAPADIEAIRRWRNAQMRVLRQERPISEAEQTAYFASRIWPTLAEPEPRNILIALEEDGALIGYGGLVHIAWAHRRAEVSFLLAPELVANEASYARRFTGFLGLLRELAFDDLGLARLWTETYAFRTHHIAVLEGAGFKCEGVMRRHVIIDGSPVDSVVHGCLAAE